MKLAKKLKIVYRNRFFRALRFLLPRNAVVSMTIRGVPIYSVFFVGTEYSVRVRHVEFWNFYDRIFFRILLHEGE
jgi:hypothetical protein